MFALSWWYLYGVGGFFYAAGAVICIRQGVLDLKVPAQRRVFVAASSALLAFALVHGLFQFVFPYIA